MADLSVGGLATGIDTKSLISQLMDLERNPQRILYQKKTKLQSKVDEFTKINNALTSLKNTMAGMNTSATFMSKTASVGDSTVLSVSAGSTAGVGTHTITVSTLASSQTQVSGGYADATLQNFGTGTITITGGATPITVNIDATNNSLNGIAAAINSSGANVTASVINDGSATPNRLSITGKDTATYTIAPTLTGGTYASPVFAQTQAASMATFTLDGVAFTKTSNSVTDAVSGATLTLLKPNTPGSTTFTISNDVAGVTAKINTFISSYNDAMALMNKQSDYDKTTKKAGVLSGDSTLRNVKSQVQSILSNEVSGVTGAYKTLSQIGIKTNYQDGTISVDSAKLSAALSSNFNDVVDLFTRNTGTPSLSLTQYGVAEQFNQQLDMLTHYYVGPSATNNGIIPSRLNGLANSITDTGKQMDAMELRLTQKETSLKKQFAAMEKLVSSLTSQGNSLISSLNRM